MPDSEKEPRSTADFNASAEGDDGRVSTAGGLSAEAQARQAEAEFREHVRGAHVAAAKLTSLTAKSAEQEPGLPTLMRGDDFDAMAMHKRVGRTERALAATVVAAEVQKKFFPEQQKTTERIGGSVVSWAPLLFLNPGRRSGFRGVASDPRWQSAAGIIAIFAGKEMLDRVLGGAKDVTDAARGGAKDLTNLVLGETKPAEAKDDEDGKRPADTSATETDSSTAAAIPPPAEASENKGTGSKTPKS